MLQTGVKLTYIASLSVVRLKIYLKYCFLLTDTACKYCCRDNMQSPCMPYTGNGGPFNLPDGRSCYAGVCVQVKLVVEVISIINIGSLFENIILPLTVIVITVVSNLYGTLFS